MTKSYVMGSYISLVSIWAAMMTICSPLASADVTTNHYATTNGPGPSPYTNWATAASNIQDAVNAAASNDTVWVTNGTYVLTNQIMIDKGITVCSVNGATNTIINGNYPIAINRCFYINGELVSVIVDGFTITNGYSVDTGGGVYFYFGGILRNCNITGNHAGTNGGGIYTFHGGTVYNCTVAGNAVSNTAGKGGGIYCDQGGMVSNCLISKNNVIVSGDDGTGYGSGGGGVALGVGGAIQHCTISSNTVSCSAYLSGGGGALITSSGSISNSTIFGNTTDIRGGGVVLNGAGLICNCLISSNTANADGNGVMVMGSGAKIWNCTIVQNGINAKNGLKMYAACTIENTIIYYNAGANWSDVSGVSFSNCCTIPTNFTAGVVQSGCFTNPPQFVDTNVGNYRLSSSSPCINTGMNRNWMTDSYDLDWHRRIDRISGLVDMGAYEFIYKITLFQFH